MIACPELDHHAHPPATVRLGDLEVRRMGYGAMRLPGPDVWGEPEDAAAARTVLRRAVDLGVQLIDTAWFYGPMVANRLIAEALHPYPADLVIATKLGSSRGPDRSWVPALRPEALRDAIEHDLRSLRRERLDLVHLRWMTASPVPLAEALDCLIALQSEGKLRHIGLSNVGMAELELALARTPIAAVQNLYNLGGGDGVLARRTHCVVDAPEQVLARCEREGIAFLPFFPLAMGTVAQGRGALDEIARFHDATPAQIALAWLLARSKVMLPIPGTRSLAHLEQNWAARRIALTPEQFEALRGAAAQT
ncbi:MAG: aldo/keto reductase [Nannocystaceae bacterium]